MKNPWFRMYTEFLHDPKIVSLAFEDQRHFIGVLALKSAGILDQECPADLMNKIVAQQLWLDHSAVVEVKRRLIEAGLIDAEWQPLAWEKRQCPSDKDPTGAERQKRYRRKHKNDTDQGNGSSDALRNASSNGDDNASVTPAEEIREEQIRQDKDIAAAGGSPPAHAREATAGDCVSPAATDSPIEKPPPKPASPTAVVNLADWAPSVFARQQLERYGIDAETVEAVLPEFRAYWQQRPDRYGLDAKFIRQCRRYRANGANERRRSWHESRQKIVDFFYDFSDTRPVEPIVEPWDEPPDKPLRSAARPHPVRCLA